MADPFATSTDITASERIMLETSVMELLEPEPGSMPSEMQAAGPDIPALREQLARLVSTGKSKEAIGVQLTHDQVKRLTDKDVEKYFTRYEAYVGAKTTENLIDSALTLFTKAASLFVPLKNIEALQKELKNDYIINNELSNLVGVVQENVPQVTSTTPATKPAKNPKRVAAGKLAAEKTKQAREAQKKAAVEAAAIIAKEKEKKSAAAKRNVTPPVTEPAPTESPPESSGLSTNQWISLLGIGVAIITTYVKREDIKAFIKSKTHPAKGTAPEPEPAQEAPAERQRISASSKIPQPKRGIRPMD
ncbi:hypothetical protein ACROYT_G035830 [Oculina patagonica]